MPELEIIMGGYSINTDQTRLGLCTVTLIRGEVLSIVDVGHFGRRNLLVDSLAASGLELGDIGRVILTHSHWDHSQNTDLFPNAEIVIHADELEYTRNPRDGDLATARYFANTLLTQNVREVRGETELEPGVRLIETPGHTRGHISVVVETDGGTVCVGGDAMSDAGAIGRGAPAIIFWSEADARESIRKIVAAADTIYPGHDRPFRIEANGDITYLSDSPTLEVSGVLHYAGGAFTLNIGRADHPGTTVMPSAIDYQGGGANHPGHC